MRNRSLSILLILCWLAAIAAAAAYIDRPMAELVKLHPPFDKHRWFVFLLKLPGYFYFSIALAFVLWLAHPSGAKGALLVLLSGIVGGLMYCLLKWLTGRHRPVNGIQPFHLTPLAGGLKGLFVSPPNLSFPSGHATLSFATATAMSLVLPRWRPAFFLIATMVCAERVLENAHYVSDVIAGAGVGVLSAYLVAFLIGIRRDPRTAI